MTTAQAWSPWYVGLWVLWGLIFCVLEANGLLHKNDPYPPLTDVVHRYMPMSLTIAGIVWLLLHFLETYQVIA